MTDPVRPTDDELTRREWLLRLGGLTALAGVSGVVPFVPGAIAAQTSSSSLPPGLYEPSSEHLSHVLASRDAPVVPRGTETDYAAPRTGPFHPRFFGSDELRVVTLVVGSLLGGVDERARSEAVEWLDLRLHSAAAVRHAARRLDPLHRALAVAYSGEARVADLETSDPQTLVRSALKQLEQRARERSGRPFDQLTEPDRVDLLLEVSRAPADSSLRRGYDVVRREAIREIGRAHV